MSRSVIARLAVLSVCACLVAILATPSLAQQQKGKKYALLVGVKDYKGQSFSELKYPERDVEELKKILDQSGYQVRLLTTAAGKKDRADAPTTANIRKEFAALIKGRARGDTVLLALSGHGLQIDVKDKRGEKEPISYGYFCPSDADFTDISYSTGYSDHLILVSDLFERMGKCQATNKLVFMDACRNEISTKAGSRNVDLDSMKVPRGVAALFSCSKMQRAWEHDDLKHGVFFHYVLEGLRGKVKNEDGEVTWDGLSAYVKRQVRIAVPKLHEGGAKQTPHGVGSLEDDPVLVVVSSSSIQPKDKGTKIVAAGKKYALVIGTDKFRSSEFPGLKYAESDAENLAKALGDKKAGFEVTVMTTARGQKQNSAQPTAANIRAALKRLASLKSRQDTIFVAFVGTGTGNYYCPTDCSLTDAKTAIGYDEIHKTLTASSAGTKLIVVDACRNAGKAQFPDIKEPTPASGVAALYGCKFGQVCFEANKLKGGFFTHFFVEGLKGKAANRSGNVTWASLAEYVSEQVSDAVPILVGDGAKQTPHQSANLVGSSPVLATK